MSRGDKNTKILIVLTLSLFLAFSGCRSSQRTSKKVKEAENAEMAMQKESDKEYNDAINQHNKMQSKNSKQTMKDQKKLAKKYNKSQKRSLWDRTFNNSCK